MEPAWRKALVLRGFRPAKRCRLASLRELLNSEPAFWRWFALLAFGHERTAVSAVADLMIRDHVKRLVAVLLWLADARTISPEGSGAIEVEASQSDLATMANVARTTANATLRRLVSARQVKLASPLCP
jgi:CRP/FNR family transcriptional regulator, cyclic AMP receptor protein